ncbi:MAG: GDSL-type esterase/lipase family protein, partial [Pseudomonadales bacterium]
RLPQLLQDYQPELLIVELGANDGLRGQPIKLIEANLENIVRLGKQHGSQVYLLGMHIPPNYGSKYTSQFHAVFQNIAKQENVALLPFFLQEVATDPTLMQADGLHPNSRAQPRLLENMLSKLPASALRKTEGEPH